MHHTDRQHLPFGHSSAILDTDTVALLGSLSPTLIDVLYNTTINDVFCRKYLDWINSGTLNTISGLEKFPIKCYSNGTSEAFDKFYMKHSTRRLRCFRGEYMYHQLAWRSSHPGNWSFLEDDVLDDNDAIVISLPFADTGDEHQLYQTLLTDCDRLKIPVLVDCAYYGICSNINFNFDYACITDIVFSLSKMFPVSHARIGMRLSREDDDDSLQVYNKSLYTNRLGAYIGMEFIQHFSPDYIVNKYKVAQERMCLQSNTTVSNTVLFGIDDSKYPEYNRGRATNRLSFHKFFHVDNSIFKNELQR